MTIGLTQLIEDAEQVKRALKGLAYDLHYAGVEVEIASELETVDRILDYLRERDVPPSEPGSYKDARGALEAMNDVIRRHNKPAL